MYNPLLHLVRFLSLKSNKSHTPHHITTLTKIKSVVVLVDSTKDSSQTIGAIKSFFDYQHIKYKIFSIATKNLNIWGFLKKNIRSPKAEIRDEQLFISLVDTNTNFAAKYEALCSRAEFKMGINTEESVFDIVVTPKSEDVSQSAIFASIKEYLSIIK